MRVSSVCQSLSSAGLVRQSDSTAASTLLKRSCSLPDANSRFFRARSKLNAPPPAAAAIAAAVAVHATDTGTGTGTDADTDTAGRAEGSAVDGNSRRCAAGVFCWLDCWRLNEAEEADDDEEGLAAAEEVFPAFLTPPLPLRSRRGEEEEDVGGETERAGRLRLEGVDGTEAEAAAGESAEREGAAIAAAAADASVCCRKRAEQRLIVTQRHCQLSQLRIATSHGGDNPPTTQPNRRRAGNEQRVEKQPQWSQQW